MSMVKTKAITSYDTKSFYDSDSIYWFSSFDSVDDKEVYGIQCVVNAYQCVRKINDFHQIHN